MGDPSEIKIKILVLGPTKSGKTMISNYLADANELSAHEYRPTKGVRIVEFESNELELDGKRVDADVELWDCSGNAEYERCWPVLRNNTDGVILVCRPDVDSGSSLLPWYKHFVERANIIGPSNVLVLLHTSSTMTNDAPIAEFRLPNQMKSIQVFPTNIETEGDSLRLEFNSFLCRVISNLRVQRRGSGTS